MKMRVGEIVRVEIDRHPEIGKVKRFLDTPAGCVVEVMFPNLLQELYPSDLEIVTVEELFAAAGFPVPEGLKLCYHHDWFACSESAYGCRHLLRLHQFDQDYKWFELSGGLSISGAIDLSRLPALDAWDALPKVVQQVVQL